LNESRVNIIKKADYSGGPVLYWMNRDQRVKDNWALSHAQSHALEKKVPLIVLFCLSPRFLDATELHYNFMLKGLQGIERDLGAKHIQFVLLHGEPKDAVPVFITACGAGMLITDQNPVRIAREWKAAVASVITIPMIEVDAHNIVPVWKASPKLEYGAYTLRPKLQRLLPEFLDDVPPLMKHPFIPKEPVNRAAWGEALSSLRAPAKSGGIPSCEPGEAAARAMLNNFITHRLAGYGTGRNDPTLDFQSHLSAYLHFGHLSAQRIALEVQRTGDSPSVTDFLEEMIVRRELSDNFCHYNASYDDFAGFPAWARQSLNEHRADARSHLYSLEQFERALTHDDLWNAAQREMLSTGRMHGYMRMYWAKKILEWTGSPEEALAIAIHLNDTYELDGRDPNGYAGIAWSIGGVHDRAWFERPVYGKIRYMNANGCARKFDVKAYCAKFNADNR
jgi:deoxyribodipyrimidine photo-lyase